MNIDDLKVVEQTYEVTRGDWIYRVRQNAQGCFVTRVPVDQQYWNHGVIKQMYDFSQRKFLPTIRAEVVVLPNMTAAIRAIETA